MIEYSNSDGIARITFNAPETGNKITLRMMTDFIAALEDASRNGALLLVIRSNGDSFTLGRDQTEKVALSRQDNLALILKANEALRHFPGVSIALIRGRAMGFGSGVALHSSIAIAEDGAIFGFDEIRHGLAPLIVVAYLPYFLPPKVGHDLALTGRDVPAEEAQRLGLVARLVPEGTLAAAGEALIAELLSLPRGALRVIRRFTAHHAPYPSSDELQDAVQRLARWVNDGKPEDLGQLHD